MNNENPIIDDAQTIDAEHSLGNTDSWRAVQKKTSLMQLLEIWFNEDEQEQHDTLEALKKALDKDRPSDRKLFV